jgi:hypothetical protein
MATGSPVFVYPWSAVLSKFTRVNVFTLRRALLISLNVLVVCLYSSTLCELAHLFHRNFVTLSEFEFIDYFVRGPS